MMPDDKVFRVALAVIVATALMAAAMPARAGEDEEDNSEFNCCYKVVGVRPTDVLKMRAQPGWLDTDLGSIPPDGRNIRRGVCRGNWCMVQYGRAIGWVSQTYLARDDAQPDAVTTELPKK